MEDQHQQGNDMPTIDRFKGKYEFLSNFYPAFVESDGISYPTVEHAFVAMKTQDKNIRKQIADLRTPAEAKKFGRTLELRQGWNEMKVSVMRELLFKKFSNPNLRSRLKNTEGFELIEGNFWHDNFWGACSCDKCKQIEKQNMLGKLLMEVRKEICDNK